MAESRMDIKVLQYIMGLSLIHILICVYPFYYLIINTISANDLSANGAINFLPKGFHLENYKQVFQLSGLGTLWSRRSDRMYAGMLIRQPDIRRLRILTDFSMS